MSLLDRVSSLSQEEKMKYMPDKKYEMYFNIQEGNVLIKNVPHISYTAQNYESSFIPSEIEKSIGDYLIELEKHIKSNMEYEIEFSHIVEKEYATH